MENVFDVIDTTGCTESRHSPFVFVTYQARRQGGLDEPPRLPSGPFEVFRKLLYSLLLTLLQV